MNLRTTILAMLALAMLAAQFASARVDPRCLDALSPHWRNIKSIRGFNLDVIMEYVAETIDDFWRDSILRKAYRMPVGVYYGDSQRPSIAGTWYSPVGRHRDKDRGDSFSCPSAIIVKRGMSEDETMYVLLHEIGHHLSSIYLTVKGGERDTIVWEKHADFWAGAIAYRISKKEPGWNTTAYTGRGGDRAEAFNLGWANSEYGDTPLLYYGAWDEKLMPWLWEPQTIHYDLPSEKADDGVLRRKGIPCNHHTHVVRQCRAFASKMTFELQE